MALAPHAPKAEQTAFLDTNVLLYLLSQDAAKANRTEQLLEQRTTISVQVLNEITHVCTRKLDMGWDDIASFLALVRQFCKVVALTEATHDQARFIAARHQLAFYDASIAASAMLAGCHTLYSEDMHHGLVLEGGLVVHNPFRAVA